MASPLLSICLPNLNKRPFLEARMESILAQSFRDWELIVCDSHSTDGSWEFLRKFAGDPRVRLLQIPREGIYAGINHALREARGPLLNIATSDDTCDPRFLETLAARMERHPDASLGLSGFSYIDRDGRMLPDAHPHKRAFYGDWLRRTHRRPGRTEFLLHCAFGTTWITLHALVFRRELLDRIGVFETDQGTSADEAWSLRACLASDILYEPEALVTWRQYAEQATDHRLRPDRGFQLLRGLRTVLHDPRAGIPDEWRHIDQWEERLTAVRLANYRESLGLFRSSMRAAPGLAIAGAGHALRHDPGYLLRQTASGFRPGNELSLRGSDVAADLLRVFGAPWPPSPL